MWGGVPFFLPTFGCISVRMPSTIIPKGRSVVRIAYFQKSSRVVEICHLNYSLLGLMLLYMDQ